jgi:hypothetical protein
MSDAESYSYLIINEGNRKKTERMMNEAAQEGWEVVTFTTGGNAFAYDFVVLLRKRRKSE